MDTDDLSKELYEAVFVTSDKFHLDLTLQFGVLAFDCKNEADYIKQAEKLIKEFIKSSDDQIDDIFFKKKPSKENFLLVLDKIYQNIQKVKQIPVEKRHYDF